MRKPPDSARRAGGPAWRCPSCESLLGESLRSNTAHLILCRAELRGEVPDGDLVRAIMDAPAGDCGFYPKGSAPHVCKLCDRPLDHHACWRSKKHGDQWIKRCDARMVPMRRIRAMLAEAVNLGIDIDSPRVLGLTISDLDFEVRSRRLALAESTKRKTYVCCGAGHGGGGCGAELLVEDGARTYECPCGASSDLPISPKSPGVV